MKVSTESPSSPLMRYHGAKWRIAPWVLRHFPEHRCYVEPFGGAAGVLLQKPRAYAEVYNDLDGDVVNLFRVLQDCQSRERLTELLVYTPYSRSEWQLAYELTECCIERARRTLIRAYMGFGSAGATKHKTGFRIDTRREYSTAMNLWAEAPHGIREVGSRLIGVLVENRPAIEVIKQHDSVDTLHYVDPPYLLSTRVAQGHRYYAHEMTDDDHVQLLDLLCNIEGMAIVSGYPSELYEDILSDWRCVSTSARISAARGTGKRTECLWINKNADEKLKALEVQQSIQFGA